MQNDVRFCMQIMNSTDVNDTAILSVGLSVRDTTKMPLLSTSNSTTVTLSTTIFLSLK